MNCEQRFSTCSLLFSLHFFCNSLFIFKIFKQIFILNSLYINIKDTIYFMKGGESMADTNCSIEKSNILIKSPTVLDNPQLKFDLNKTLNQMPLFTMFTNKGVPIKDLMNLGCKHQLGLQMVPDKPSFAGKIRFGVNCKNDGVVFKLGCSF